MLPGAEPFFIKSGKRRLLGVWQGTDSPARAAALFCHPLGEEKKCAHRAFVETARALARRQIASLRFDLSGCGDSDGEFEDVSFADWSEDISAAWDELGRRAPETERVLIGLRLGASLAALASERLDAVSALLLWQPVVDGKAEFSAGLRRLLIQQMITSGRASTRREDILAAFERGEGEIELDGYPIGASLYQDICRINLAREHPAFPAACGTVQFSRRQSCIEAFARAAKIKSVTVNVPPIWIRSDFLPTEQTGGLLAREAVLPWLEDA